MEEEQWRWNGEGGLLATTGYEGSSSERGQDISRGGEALVKKRCCHVKALPREHRKALMRKW